MTTSLLQQLREVRGDYAFPQSDFLSIDDIKIEDVEMIFVIARIFRNHKTAKIPLLQGKSIGLAFFESSTRTRSSFDWSGKHLGADVVGVGSGTAEKKGESLIDVAQSIDAMNASILVVRSSFSGLPEQLARHTSAAVINAGDGWHEHPTQGLLDALTIMDSLGSGEGKTITIVGDILHSRVFGSLSRIAKLLGMNIRVAAPHTLIPEQMESVFGVTHYTDVEKALPGSDVVYTLRVQGERGSQGDISTLREYSKAYGISPQRLSLAKKNALLMHPGPIQRDIDIHHALVATEQSQVLRQVENGVAIRKVILWLLATPKHEKIFSRI